MTPLQLGIKRGTVIPPSKGWRPETFYIVEVAYSGVNVIHRSIFYSGFLSKAGKPGGYNTLMSPYSDDYTQLSDTFFLKAIEKLDINLRYSEQAND